MYLEATTLQHKVRTENKYFQHRALIPDVSGMNTERVRYTRFLQISPELAPFDFYLQTKLYAPTRDDNIHREPAQELEQHKYQMKCELRHDICFTEVRTRSSPTLR